MSDTDRPSDRVLTPPVQPATEARSAHDGEAMLRCLGVLAVASDPSSLFDSLLPIIIASFAADNACVLASNELNAETMSIIADSSSTRLGLRLLQRNLLNLFEEPSSVAVDLDANRLSAWHEPPLAPPCRSALLLHIGSSAQPTLLVCCSTQADRFKPCHLDLAQALAPIIGQALARAKDHHRLRLEVAELTRIEHDFKRQQTTMVHMQKMEAIAQLAAGMAHEINTPLQYASDNLRFLTGALAAISGTIPSLSAWLEPHIDKDTLRQFLDMSDVNFLSAEAPKAAEQCREGIDRVGSIVRSLKRFAETDSGAVEPSDINEAVRTTAEICAAELRDVADLHLVLGDVSLVPCRVAELRQVMHNLIRNAVQAIADRATSGRGTITITTQPADAAVEICVQDDGCGMDAEVLRRACEPFFTTRGVGQGGGQGLTIAHDVVHRQGGELALESQPGHGTTVRIRLATSPAAQRKS